MLLDQSFYDAAQSILQGLGAQPQAVNVNLLAAWSWCEKPHYAGGAWQWWNPLNTTEPWPGSTCVNSVCVRQYPSQADGVAATVATLTNGYYPDLVAALLTSDSGRFFAAGGQMATWGTSLACIQSVYALLEPPPGVTQPPPPAPPPPLPPPPSGVALEGAGLGALLALGGVVAGAWAAHAAYRKLHYNLGKTSF